MAKRETVARLLGWQITKYGVRRMERRGAFDAELPAYDTDANASRELLAYVAKGKRIIEFITDLHRIIGDEVVSDCGSNWAMLNATPQQIYAAFCATFACDGSGDGPVPDPRDAELATLRQKLAEAEKERDAANETIATGVLARGKVSAALAASEAACAAMRGALEKIRTNEGKVCGEFELCTHVACQSSYNAYAIADAALADPHGTALLERLKLAEAVIAAATRRVNDAGQEAHDAWEAALSSWRKSCPQKPE